MDGKDIFLSGVIIILLIGTLKTNGQQIHSATTDGNKALTDFDYNKPLFELNDEQSKNTYRHLRFSLISGYREGVKPTTGFGSFGNTLDTANGTARFYMINLSIQDLLTLGFNIPNNQFVLEVKDESKYRYTTNLGAKLDWMRKNTFCFEYLRPIGVYIDAATLKSEVARYFDVSVTKELRMTKVLVLKRTSLKDKIRSKGKTASMEIMNNVPLSDLSKITDSLQLPKLFDETGYIGLVDLNLDVNSSRSLTSLTNALRAHDLDLKEEMREIEMFVIHENFNNL